MRRLALLFAGGAVWLFLAAIPVFADGGPHSVSINSGSTSLAGDCAACHRAHTAKASNLLKEDVNTLCYSCHKDGLGATTDVSNGVQYTPNATDGQPVSTDSVLGALRAGGFEYALIDSSNAFRLAYWSTSRSTTAFVAKVPVLGTGLATTSNHLNGANGTNIVWGNGAPSTTTANYGYAGVTLECTDCHNPHGNGNYRILQEEPGDTWAGTTSTFLLGGPVTVPDATPADATGVVVRNYTVKPGALATDVSTAYTGDYWRYKYDPAGLTGWDNTALSADPKQGGWTGTTTADVTSTSLNAFCVTCHTRYNGQQTNVPGVGNEPSSVVSPDNDAAFMYRHGTTRVGCTQCHVSHGSNAAMDAATAPFAANYAYPNGTLSGDSRLLKVDNRGTCQLCHDPTKTYNANPVGGDTGSALWAPSGAPYPPTP